MADFNGIFFLWLFDFFLSLLLLSDIQCKYEKEKARRKELHNELIVSLYT